MFKKISIVFTIFILLFANVPAMRAETEMADLKEPYEIYPIPQKEVYADTTFELTKEINVVIGGSIDESTTNFLYKILSSQSLAYTLSEEVVSNQTNILLGTKNDDGYVETYIDDNVDYDANVFNEIDAYVLSIDDKIGENGTISILGNDTDAAYYGLATLRLIFDQLDGQTIRSVTYEDYADSKWRGFIEGFYGFPWTDDARKSLMEFGGQFKMNSYIFGPKDDKYHNSEWRTPYPADELAKIKELVDVGHESKTQFIWAIHPGFSMVKWDDYDNELAKLLAKFEQLYSIGVRQFGLFMDDINLEQSLKDKDNHVKLIKDIVKWIDEKGDVKPLIYCPPFYNQAWTGESGKPYLNALQNTPESVEIMWTGDDVIGGVNTKDMQWAKDEIGRDPYVWFNYPVNGYKKNRLLLGKVPMLEPGTKNFSGIVSNPLEQAELSKVALFGIADFTWNVDDFDNEKSWEDSFKYITPEVASAFRTIAGHMSDPYPNVRGVEFDESEDLKENLELFLDLFSKNQPVGEAGNVLNAAFDEILEAIDTFKTKGKNEALLTEIEPWLNSLHYVVLADKHVVNAVIAIQKNDINKAWDHLSQATEAMANSKKFTRKVINEADQIVEAGFKRLVPFANELIDLLGNEIYLTINPNAEIVNLKPMSSYGGVNLDLMVDGDEETFSYIQTRQKNDDWYGVDLGREINVTDIKIIQGKNDNDHDIFQRGILEYSNDMENWTAIGKEREGHLITEKDLNIDARYIRYRLTHAGIPGGKPDLWTAIREFTVNDDAGDLSIYTNVSGLEGQVIEKTESSASLLNLGNITLAPNEYVGIQLSTIERISGVDLKGASSDVTLEVSENAVEWKAVKAGESFPNAAYLRLINDTDGEIEFELEQMIVSFNKLQDPVVTHNYEGIHQGKLDNLYNGSMEEKVWFAGAQAAGKYVQIDMGGIVDVENIKVVIGDGEGDYFREGNLQISADGKTWETVHTFDNPNDSGLNYPTHVAPYRYKQVEVDKKPARYIRLISTKDSPKWMALNTIIVNEGTEAPQIENLTIQAEPEGGKGSEAGNVIDGSLSSFYTPDVDGVSGYLNYKLHRNTNVEQIVILQSSTNITNADVSIRDLKGWHKIGKLSTTTNILSTKDFQEVLEVKIEWDDSVKPQIFELITLADAIDVGIDISPLNDLIGEASAITNDGIYTTDSFDALQAAIIAAKASLETIKTEAELNEAIAGLQAAIDGLEKVEEPEEPEIIDVARLEDLIEEALSITNDGIYTADSFDALQSAIAEAKESLKTIKTEEALNEAVAGLQAAIDGLEKVEEPEEPKIIDVARLEDLIKEALAITNDGAYTAESFNVLQSAIAKANASLETIETEAELNEAIAGLQAAIDGLEKAEEPETPVTPGTPGTPGVPGTPGTPEEPTINDTDKDDSHVDVTIDEDGEELPKTATPIYNWILAGLLLIIIGATITIKRSRRINQ